MAEWGKTTLIRDFTRPIFWARLRTPPDMRDGAALTAALDAFDRHLGLIEARIGDGPYLFGPDLTLADIVIGHVLYRYFTLDIPRRDRPGIAQYYARLQQRPAYRTHVMVPYDILRAQPL